MIQATVFRMSVIQCVIFTPHLAFRSSDILAHLLEHWKNDFDGQPLTMPIPDDAPAEIPRILLKSVDDSLRMEIARGRTSVLWNRTSEGGDPEVSVVVEKFRDILQDLTGHVNVLPGRLALVLNRVLPIENPARKLAEHFCKDAWIAGPLNRSENFELHALKKYRLAQQFDVNSWVRVKTGQRRTDGMRVVLVEQDINTLAEELETQQFQPQQMRDFFLAAVPECDQIFELYFPNT